MSQQTLRNEADALGFYPTRVIAPGVRPATRWATRCTECDTQFTFNWDIATAPTLMTKNIQQAGWIYTNKRRVCPACVAKAKQEKQMTKLEPISNPKLQRRVFALLDDHFNEERRLYAAGWSDKRIAEEAHTSEQFVESLRRGAYGELAEDPTVTALRLEIEALRNEAHKMSDDLLEQMGKIETKITQLHSRLDGYALKKAG